MKKVGIVGAGIAGIATAIRLASKGYQVHVFDANSYPGGKLAEIRLDGYRFDAGPSLFTMPQYVDELFNLAKKNPKDYFDYQKLEIACRYFYEDGTIINAYTNPQKFALEVKEKLGVEEKVIINHLKHSAKIYNAVGKLFLEKSLHKIGNYLSFDTLKALFYLPQIDLYKTLHQSNQARLKHPKLIQLFNRFATYNGSSPYLAPGILNVIPNLEHNIGAYFPKGGMYSITNSLYQLAKDIGVQFHFDQPVSQILLDQRKIAGLSIGNQKVNFDKIVSNADVYPTYKKLLNIENPPKRALSQSRSSSALIFYWGIKKEFKQLDLHNIFFSQHYEEEFDFIFNKGKTHPDPTVYINITSIYNPEDAPAGHQNWFTMINVPPNTGQDWDDMITKARKSIITKLSRMLGENIEKQITTEEILEPRTIESKTSSYQGSLYGASHNQMMAAFHRHPNFSQQIKGLYFCGGSVHPGGGIPLCLLSAKIVEEVIN
ncbi:MAG: 1-hydroxycarotenoid 3,4-desaturase CrtD [Cyclobacteriaceae bacterium]